MSHIQKEVSAAEEEEKAGGKDDERGSEWVKQGVVVLREMAK